VFLFKESNFTASVSRQPKESRTTEMFDSGRRKLQLKLVTGAMALMLSSSFALAQAPQPFVAPGPMHGDMMGPHGLRFLIKYLDLSDAQQTQIKQLMSANKAAAEPLMQQEHQNHLQMTQLVQSGNFDETKAQGIAASQAQTMTQMIVQRATLDANIFQQLTPAQKTKMTQLTAEREQHFAGRMSRLQQHDQPQPPND
jgi:protein CpxP